MPEVVQKYVDTKDFREVDKIQRSLLLGYQYDIAHYLCIWLHLFDEPKRWVRSRRYFSLYLQEGGVVLFFLLTNKGVDRDYQRPSFCCLRGGSD